MNSEKISDMEVHYLKTGSYRTYHVDGIFGGLSPRGILYVEPFVERAPTPTMIKHEITADGRLGEEILRQGKSGVIREIECGLIMDFNTAKTLHKWLGEKISMYDEKKEKETEND